MFGLGPLELLIVGIIAVLLFGNRLPEVGRSLGKGLVEFKKGVQGIEDRPDGDQPAK
jgi:sec-independent protein translocase protein TatA